MFLVQYLTHKFRGWAYIMNGLVGTLLLAAGFILGQVTTSLGIHIKHNENNKRLGRR